MSLYQTGHLSYSLYHFKWEVFDLARMMEHHKCISRRIVQFPYSVLTFVRLFEDTPEAARAANLSYTPLA